MDGCIVQDNLVLFSLWNRPAPLDNEMFKLRPLGAELVTSNRNCRGGSTAAGVTVEAVLDGKLLSKVL
jgi:hypothetical protein